MSELPKSLYAELVDLTVFGNHNTPPKTRLEALEELQAEIRAQITHDPYNMGLQMDLRVCGMCNPILEAKTKSNNGKI